MHNFSENIENNKTIHIACSFEESFVMSAAAMLRSAAENLCEGYQLHVYALHDETVTSALREKLLASLDGLRITVAWLTPDFSSYKSKVLFTGPAGHPTAYFRILLPEILPKHLSKVLYLDVDMIIDSDISELWHTNLKEFIVGAVQSPTVPTFQSFYSFEPSEIDFSKEKIPYFNSGVLLINLNSWRSQSITENVLHYAVKYRNDFRFNDQDPLNCALAGKWLPLSPQWNESSRDLCLSREYTPYSEDEYEQWQHTPKIIHYTYRKPWHPGCLHSKQELFFEYLNRTEWKNFRSENPVGLLTKIFFKLERESWYLASVYIVGRRNGISRKRNLSFIFKSLLNKPYLIPFFPLLLLKRTIASALIRNNALRRVMGRPKKRPLPVRHK